MGGGGGGGEGRTDTQLSGLQASMGAQGLISQKSLDKRLSPCLVGSKEYILPEVFENKVNNTLGHSKYMLYKLLLVLHQC